MLYNETQKIFNSKKLDQLEQKTTETCRELYVSTRVIASRVRNINRNKSDQCYVRKY